MSNEDFKYLQKKKFSNFIIRYIGKSREERIFEIVHYQFDPTATLVVRLYRTGNFLQNLLGFYSETTQDSETNDTSFDSPIIELLQSVMKEGVAVS